VLSELIKGIRTQSRSSVSQAISLIENQGVEAAELLSGIHPFTGKAYRIGITGPPGAGKSSITDQLISHYRSEEKTVAVVAVDPSSPFSGGAVLGDRIRMTNHFSDKGVFVRSMATRGSQGGLSVKTQEAGDIFDAAGFDIVLFETVGVGQIELDVIRAADSVVVVLVPESGDEVQMLKAGLMEIGNIFAINKADRPGANKLMITLQNILSTLPHDAETWIPKVVHTVATEGKGINQLSTLIDEHRQFSNAMGITCEKQDDRYKSKVMELVTAKLLDSFWKEESSVELDGEIAKEFTQRKSPYDLVQQLMK
jgi:LAO/AO transport system kinase